MPSPSGGSRRISATSVRAPGALRVARPSISGEASQAVISYTDYFLGPLAWLAPGTPRALASGLAALDDLMLKVPLLRRAQQIKPRDNIQDYLEQVERVAKGR